MEMKKHEYKVTLPDGRKMLIYFIGKQLEIIFRSYGVMFEEIGQKNKREY